MKRHRFGPHAAGSVLLVPRPDPRTGLPDVDPVAAPDEDGAVAAPVDDVHDLGGEDERFPAAARAIGLRRYAARGVMINAAFQIGLAGLNLLRRLVVAVFLSVSDYGIWGILLASLYVVLFVKSAGIGDKYVQQAEADQEHAFQKAFTMDLVLGVVATALAAVVLPIFALIYGRPEIIVPGIVLSLAIVGSSLQFPIRIYYRRMQFVRQRVLGAIDPCLAFVITVSLAVAGMGYWSVIIGALAGSFIAAAVILPTSPYRIALRYERGTIRDYFSFSWPLVVARGTGMATVHATLVLATRTIGLVAAGAIGLAGSITTFSRGVNGIVTSTLYPAICAVRERAEVLFEAFVKSNRLALMWGMPFGIGVALFASDAVHFVYGERWEPAIVVIQAFGIVAAIDQLGFNWTAFLRALNRTKPLAILAGVQVGTFLVITAPLLVAFGLPGAAVGWVVAELVQLAGRMHFLGQLFPRFKILGHAARAVAPTVPAAGLVLLARAVEGGDRTPALAAAELGLYGAVTVGATVLVERDLLREAFGYLRGSRPAARSAGAT